jgi:hypothetical protein
MIQAGTQAGAPHVDPSLEAGAPAASVARLAKHTAVARATWARIFD